MTKDPLNERFYPPDEISVIGFRSWREDEVEFVLAVCPRSGFEVLTVNGKP
jgi:hypothetical protein